MRLSDRSYEHLFETDRVRANLKTNSVRGGFYTLAAQGGSLFINIASTSVLARLLLPTDFGLLGMLFALTAIAERFKDVGLSRATVQRSDLTHQQVSKLFWLNGALGAVIALALALLSGVIAGFYREQRLIILTIAISSTFLFSGFTIQHQALLNRQMRFGALALINTGAQVLSSILAIFLALKGYSYWSLVWREISRSIVSALATWAFCPWIPGLPERRTDVSKLIAFGRNITLFNLATYSTANLDQILLGRFGGASALGIYRQAFQLIMLPINQVAGPIQGLSEPIFSALQRDVGRYRRGFQKTVSALSITTMPLAAGAFMCSRQMVALLLGARWAGAAEIVRILAVAVFVRPAISAAGFVMVTSGKTGRYALIGLLDSLILSAAIGVGVMWGAVGIAWGHVAATYVVFLPVLWWAFRDTPVDLGLWFGAVAEPAASSITMVLVLHVLSSFVTFPSNIVALTTLVVIGAGAYFAVMTVLPGGRSKLACLLGDLRFGSRRPAFQPTDVVVDA